MALESACGLAVAASRGLLGDPEAWAKALRDNFLPFFLPANCPS
jgi:hypothetical protein